MGDIDNSLEMLVLSAVLSEQHVINDQIDQTIEKSSFVAAAVEESYHSDGSFIKITPA